MTPDLGAALIEGWSRTHSHRVYIFHATEKFSALRLRWPADTSQWTMEAYEALSEILDRAEQESRDICPRCGPR